MAKTVENQADEIEQETAAKFAEGQDFQTEMNESGPAPDEVEPDSSKDSANREAAKYRTRLRETEAERDTLRNQLTAMRKSMIDQALEKARLKPAAFWSIGTKVEDLLSEDGTPDSTLIQAAITQTRDMLGIPDIPKVATDGSGGTWRGDDIVAEEPGPTWGGLINK